MSIPDRNIIKEDLLVLLYASGEGVTPQKAYEALAVKWKLTDAERAQQRSNGALYQHEIRWARQELVIAGFIGRRQPSARGLWVLVSREGATEWVSPEERTLGALPEGAVTRVTANRYERSFMARVQCIAYHGVICKACGDSLEQLYGSIAAGRTHVHHLVPVSAMRKSYQVDPVADLVPLCPNCHFVAHLRNPPLSIAELSLLRRTAKKS